MFRRLLKRRNTRHANWQIYLDSQLSTRSNRVGAWLRSRLPVVGRRVVGWMYAILVTFMFFCTCYTLSGAGKDVSTLEQDRGEFRGSIRPQMVQPVYEPTKELKSLWAFLDSLRSDSNGRKIYDSLALKIPGLSNISRQLQN